MGKVIWLRHVILVIRNAISKTREFTTDSMKYSVSDGNLDGL